MAPPRTRGHRKRAFKWPKRKEVPTKKRRTPSPVNLDEMDLVSENGTPVHLSDNKIAALVTQVLDYSFTRDRDEGISNKGMTFGEIKAYIAEKYKMGTAGVETIEKRLMEQLNKAIEDQDVIMVTSKRKKKEEELAKKFKCRELSIILKDVFEEGGQDGNNLTMRVELQIKPKQSVSEQSSGGKSEQRFTKKRTSRVYLEDSD